MRVNFAANNNYNNRFKNTEKLPYNKKNNSLKADEISFNGKKEGVFTRFLNQTFGLDEIIAKGTAKLSQTKASKYAVDTIRKFKNPTARLSDLESFAVTYFYVRNTAKSKKIEKERKVPSIIQNIAVTIVSSSTAALLDKACDPAIDALTTAYSKLPKDTIKKIGGKTPKEFYDAARILKSSTVFTAVVRFIVPVMMVPVVGKIVEKIKEKTDFGDNNKNKPAAPVPAFKYQNDNLNQKKSNDNVLSGLSQINSLNLNHIPGQTDLNENKFATFFAQG